MWGGGDASYGGGDGGGFGGGGLGGDGGGFGAGGFGSPSGGSQDKRKSAAKGQSLMPCTVAQLNGARHDEDGSFYINDKELNHVLLVGVVRSVQETSTNLAYTVDDMTGEPITVRKYIQDNETGANRRSECREGLYVRVAGHLRSFNDSSRSVLAFMIQPVADFNEITMHMLEVIHAHLYLKKGASLAPKQENKMSNTMTGMGTNRGASTAADGAGGLGQGFDRDQQQVYSCIMQCRDSQGLNVNVLLEQTRKHGLSEAAVRKALDWLSQEGHIYSTIDDHHYKSTDDF